MINAGVVYLLTMMMVSQNSGTITVVKQYMKTYDACVSLGDIWQSQVYALSLYSASYNYTCVNLLSGKKHDLIHRGRTR